MGKNLVILIVIFAIIGGGYYLYVRERNKPQPQTNQSVARGCLANPKKSANINIASPANYVTVNAGGFTVEGRAQVFENQFNYRITNCSGRILTQGQLNAVGLIKGMPTFSKTIKVNLTTNSVEAILEMFDYSAKNGSMTDLTQVPITIIK